MLNRFRARFQSKRAALQELNSIACPQCAHTDQWRIGKRPSLRLNSLTFEASCGTCGSLYFCKQLVNGSHLESTENAKLEYLAARQSYDLFPSSLEYGLVCPRGLFGRTILFDLIEGKTPTHLLRTGKLDLACAAMNKMGGWLAKFHQTSEKDCFGNDLTQRFAAIKVRSIEQAAQCTTVSRALSYLDTSLVILGSVKKPICKLHGDAKPDNFLWDGKRIVGLDISGAFSNFPEHDVAQFLTQYSLSLSSILGHTNHKRNAALQASFLSGYEREMPIDTRLLAWLRVYYLLTFWMTWRNSNILGSTRWDRIFIHRVDGLLEEFDLQG